MTPISLTCPVLTGGAFPAIPTMWHTITMTPRERALNPVQRRALQLLASSPYGATEALMLARGFTRRTLAGLVRAELATARHEIVKAGDKTIDVVRVRITAAGRWAVEG